MSKYPYSTSSGCALILELLSLFFILRYQLPVMEKDRVLAWIKERESKMCSAKGEGNTPGETEKKAETWLELRVGGPSE